MNAKIADFNITTKELFVSKNMSSVDVFEEISVQLDDLLHKGFEINFNFKDNNEQLIFSSIINSKSEKEELISKLKLLNP